jgi:pre-rRNA-processing protein TSR1
LTRDVKVFQTTSGGGCVPRVVAVVPLHRNSSCVAFTKGFLVNVGLNDAEREKVEAQLKEVGSWVVE